MINKRLMNLLKDSKKYVAQMVIWNWIALLCNVVFIFSFAYLLENLLNNSINTNMVIIAVVIDLLVVIIRSFCYKKSSNASFYAAADVKKTLRENIYNKLLRLGSSYEDKVPTAEIVQVSGEGVEQLEIYFGKYLAQLFYSLAAPVTLFIILAFVNIKASAVLLACVPLIPLSIVAVQKFAKKLLAKYWGIYTGLGDSFLENLQGLTTLKIYEADARRTIEMDKDAEQFRKITMRVLIMQLNSISVMDLVAYGGAGLGIIVALLEFSKGNLTIGGLFAIIMLSSEFFIPLRLLGSFFHIAMNGMAASDKIFNLLDAEIEKIENLTKEEMNLLKDINIEIKNVDFSYDKERKVLKNVNVTIPKGKMIALVGESGCGKSTITNLLLKQEKVDSGEITLNGIDLNYIPFEVLTKKVGFINHSAYIFNGTIEDNLRMGKFDANEREINEALKKANLYDFVQSLPEKLQTNVGEGGSLLSGGQKQRLALARTIITNPEIYIFDEATSNIDVESEEKIWRSIYELSENKTVIVISHRLANVKNADNIYVLDKGNIVESGSHKDLMMYNGKYAQLVNHQNNLESIYNDELTQKEVAISE